MLALGLFESNFSAATHHDSGMIPVHQTMVTHSNKMHLSIPKCRISPHFTVAVELDEQCCQYDIYTISPPLPFPPLLPFSNHVLSTLSGDVNKVLGSLRNVRPKGSVKFISGIRIAQVCA